MDPSLQPLLARIDLVPDEFREIREGVRKPILVADLDPEMALTRSRKVLELVVREVYQRRCQEPPGTRPLENLLHRLVKDGHLPTRVDAHAKAVRELGNVGTHGFGQTVTVADVQQSLSGLLHVLDWYVQEATGLQVPEPAQVRPAVQSPADPPRTRMAVVPKGLRSFDANDAGFFLDLLPGPRDENGLPELIRFWKHRTEATDEPGFTVGVLQGLRAVARARWSRRGCSRSWPAPSCRSTSRRPPTTPRPGCSGG